MTTQSLASRRHQSRRISLDSLLLTAGAQLLTVIAILLCFFVVLLSRAN